MLSFTLTFRSAFDALNANGSVTVKEMTSYLGVSDKTVYARMKKMKGEYTLARGRIFHLR